MKGELAIVGRIWGPQIGNSKDDQNLRTLGPEMNWSQAIELPSIFGTPCCMFVWSWVVVDIALSKSGPKILLQSGTSHIELHCRFWVYLSTYIVCIVGMRIYRTYLPFSSNQCTCFAYFFDPFLFFTTLFSHPQKIRSSHLVAHLALKSHGTTEPFTKNLQLPFQELSRHPCMYVAGESRQILAGSSNESKDTCRLKKVTKTTPEKCLSIGWFIYL